MHERKGRSLQIRSIAALGDAIIHVSYSPAWWSAFSIDCRVKLPLRIVIGQLRECERLSFTANVGHIDVSAQSGRAANHRLFVPKLDDRADDDSAEFALAVGARFSPALFPNVSTTQTLISHGAPILLELNSSSEIILTRIMGRSSVCRHN